MSQCREDSSITGKQNRNTREVNMHCLLDVVELGHRACLESMFLEKW